LERVLIKLTVLNAVKAQIASSFSNTLKYRPAKLPVMAGSYKSNDSGHRKCKECICGIQNDRGIWCARLKKIPSFREVKRCRHFCPKVILDEIETNLRDEEVLNERNH